MTHDQIAKLSTYLSHQVTSTIPLEIRPSSIAHAKHGLFTTAAIREGEEIFRSDPLITCVDDGIQNVVCDYCLSYSRSNVLPSGQFRQTEEEMQPLKTCSRCNVCYYCSKECQLNAWRGYHKYECPILSKKKNLFVRTRALYRLITMQKAGLIDAEQWDAVNHLEAHHTKYLRGPLSTSIVEIAISAKMETNMRIPEAQRIYCAILTNSMSIKSAEGSAPVLGTTLDVVGSFMNHSCNPTALVFFEGRQMRVRSLLPLRAGEEITQTYVDPSGSVFLRQAITEKDYFFKCVCMRCKNEMKKLQEIAPDEAGWIQKLDNSQQRLLKLINHAVAQHNQTGMHIELANLEADAEKIIREPFPNGVWPDDMQPLPSLYGTFARICKDNNDVAGATRCSLKASLTLRERTGDIWVHALFDTVQIVTLLCLPEQHAIFKGNSLFSKDDCWNVLYGYLGELKRATTRTFGSNSTYTKSIAWYSEAVLSAGQPCPGARRFRAVFNISQNKLLEWAGIEKSKGIAILAE